MAGINGNMNFNVGNRNLTPAASKGLDEVEKGDTEAKLPTKEIPVKTKTIDLDENGRMTRITHDPDGINHLVINKADGTSIVYDYENHVRTEYGKDGNPTSTRPLKGEGHFG